MFDLMPLMLSLLLFLFVKQPPKDDYKSSFALGKTLNFSSLGIESLAAGTNENTNGLLRQYFPKGTDFQKYDPKYLRTGEERLDFSPRKVLGWSTPAEVYYADVGF